MNIDIKFSIRLSAPATEKQIIAWARYHLGEKGAKKPTGSLSGHGMHSLKRSTKIVSIKT